MKKAHKIPKNPKAASPAPATTPSSTGAAPAGFSIPGKKRFGWKRLLVGAGALGLVYALATQDRGPEQPPAPVPTPTIPPAEPVELKTNIAVVYDTQGHIYAAGAGSFFRADQIASQKCAAALQEGEKCYGVSALEQNAYSPVCVGIGIDFLNNASGAEAYTTKVTDYLIVQDPEPQGARDKLEAARPGRPNQFALGTGVFCNYTPS